MTTPEGRAVLLVDPGPSPMDLNFRLFGTHVRVHPFFWVGAVFLGWWHFERPVFTGNGALELSIWVGCVLVSILLHEFGHVWAFRRFGNDAHVVLHAFGGLAIPDGASPRRWQRIVVSAAGPAIQLALWGALAGVASQRVLPITWDGSPRERSPLALLLLDLWFINLYWPLLNLLPIWPLDGGQISREVGEGINRDRGAVAALWVSLILSVVLAVHCLLGAQRNPVELIPYVSRYLPATMFSAIWFALFAVGSYQAIQAESARRQYWEDQYPWER